MKTVFSISFLFVLATSFANPSLIIKFERCRGASYGYEGKFSLYKDKIKIGEYETKHWFKYIVTVPNLENGTYNIQYLNAFGKIYKEVVIIEKDKKYQVQLCYDAIDTTNVDSILSNRINDKDTLKISFLSSGCFHNSSSVIDVFKKGHGYFAAYHERSPKAKSSLNPVKLSMDQFNALLTFEKELYAIENNRGCTTTDVYLVRMATALNKVTDGSCNWNGFYALRKALFGRMKD